MNMDHSTKQALELERIAVDDALRGYANDAEKEVAVLTEESVKRNEPPAKQKLLRIRLEELEKEIRIRVDIRRVYGEKVPQILSGKYLEDLRNLLYEKIDARCAQLRSLVPNQRAVPSRIDSRLDEAPRLRQMADDLLKRFQLTLFMQGKSPDPPLVFISCGQFTEDERTLGKEIEKLIHDLTGVDAYFAENQNSLQALSENVFSSLKRASAFVAIMHQRGKVQTLNGVHTRGSVWIEQEIAIAAFLRFSTGQEIPVILYLQDGEDGSEIKREGVREQLRLDPIRFTRSGDVVSDLRNRIETGQFDPGHGTAKARTAKEEARYKKAQAALEKHGEEARLVVRHLQNVDEFREGAAYDDPAPTGINGQRMREMLERLRGEELLMATMVEGPNPSRVYRIAPGMKAVLDELV